MTATDLESRCERPSFRSRPDAARAARSTGVPVLDIVVPVYNEQTALADSVHRLYAYLGDAMPFPFRITIADNASIDDTPQIAARLAAELEQSDVQSHTKKALEALKRELFAANMKELLAMLL